MSSEPKNGCLYVIDFPNGKAYYGITSRPFKQRLQEHLALARKGAPYAISKALATYDDWFIAQVLVIAPMSYLEELEVKIIEQFRSQIPHGYNQAPGGKLAPSTTFEARLALSNHKLGTRLSEETKAKLKAAWVTRPRDYKWSEAERIRRMEKQHPRAMLGRKHTPEALQKIAEASQRRAHRPEVAGDLSPMRRPEIAAKVAAANRGKRRSPGAIQRMKDAWVRRKQKQGVYA